MNLLNKLGFGHPDNEGDTNSTSESNAPAPSDADDITLSHAVIHDSSGDQYWDQFVAAIEGMSAKELNAVNYRLGAGVPDYSNWRDYVETFRLYQWFRFCEAYHWATRQTFSI